MWQPAPMKNFIGVGVTLLLLAGLSVGLASAAMADHMYESWCKIAYTRDVRHT